MTTGTIKGQYKTLCSTISILLSNFLLHCFYSFSSAGWLQTKPLRRHGSCGGTCSDGVPAPKRSPRANYIMEERWDPSGWQRWENYSKYKKFLSKQHKNQLIQINFLSLEPVGISGCAVLSRMCPLLAPQARFAFSLECNLSSPSTSLQGMHLFVKEAYAKPLFFSSLEELEACGNEIHCTHHCPIIFIPFIHLQIFAVCNICLWLEREITSSLSLIFCNSSENSTCRKVVCCVRKD